MKDISPVEKSKSYLHQRPTKLNTSVSEVKKRSYLVGMNEHYLRELYYMFPKDIEFDP